MITTPQKLGGVSVEIEWDWIIYDEDKFWFTCDCGERIKLDPFVVRKFAAEGATKLIQHLINTQVTPWLNEHRDCGKMSAFAV